MVFELINTLFTDVFFTKLSLQEARRSHLPNLSSLPWCLTTIAKAWQIASLVARVRNDSRCLVYNYAKKYLKININEHFRAGKYVSETFKHSFIKSIKTPSVKISFFFKKGPLSMQPFFKHFIVENRYERHKKGHFVR